MKKPIATLATASTNDALRVCMVDQIFSSDIQTQLARLLQDHTLQAGGNVPAQATLLARFWPP